MNARLWANEGFTNASFINGNDLTQTRCENTLSWLKMKMVWHAICEWCSNKKKWKWHDMIGKLTRHNMTEKWIKK